MSAGSEVSVKVAVRIRPLVPIEVDQACGRCLEKVKGEPQVLLGGGEKAFTFDQVYDSDSKQEDVYVQTVQPLLDSFFQGFNVTVFAYGQTGSGKTHTMGTNDGKVAGLDTITESAGIIPRIVQETFERIEKEARSGSAASHTVKVSFLEIHNDDIHDLLDVTPKTCTLREDNTGAVLVSGLEEFDVKSARELLECLGRGSSNRATASTCMNAVSSRSHAVFTITMEKMCSASVTPPSGDDTPAGPEGGGMPGVLGGSAVVARLHLVDLAGSERAKRTKAEGQRLKEGININKGLLALGNVISALTGEGGSGGHVPYRDSKLTRMLQDSLGGNSRTVMIACVSPADSNFEETLNTLKYANRAKNIKNKAVVNVSSSNAEIASLRSHIMALEAQIAGAGGGGGRGGTGMVMVDGERVKALEEEVRRLKAELYQASLEASRKTQKMLSLEIKNDKMRLLLQQHNLVDTDSSLNESRSSLGADAHVELEPEAENAAAFNGLDMVRDMGDEVGDGDHGILIQHTIQQAALSDELHTIEESLSLKEKLLDQLQEGERRMQMLKLADEDELRRLRHELEALQAERSALLKAANGQGKLAELEQQLLAMKKRVQESERALRLKHDSDRRINELRNDIEAMKSSKVQLLRKMKSDADRFREWRIEQQKEVTSLKRQQKQAEYQMHKMQAQLDKQQSVLKRKMEEANAVNIRLKTLLQKKETAKAATAARGDGKGEEGSAGMEEWMQRELQFCTEVRRVRSLLSEQMAHRAELNKEISLVKDQVQAARDKEVQEDDGSGSGGAGGALKSKLAALQNQWKARQGIKTLSPKEERQELEGRLLTLEQNVASCSAAIGQLQRELLEVEGNNDRERNVALNCPHVRSLPDAKKAVRFLFSAVVKAEVRASDSAGDSSDCEERANALACEVAHLEQKLKEVEGKYRTEMLKHEHAAEEKRLQLLSAMTFSTLDQSQASQGAGASGGGAEGKKEGKEAGGQGPKKLLPSNHALMERLRVQQEEIDRLAAVATERNELMRMQEEAQRALDEKDKELEEVRRLSGGQRGKGPAPKKKPEPKVEVLSSETETSEDDFEEEDSASDDEWMPTAPKRGGAGRVGGGRRGIGAGAGRKSNDSAGGEEVEDMDEAVACSQAAKGRGAGGGKAKGGDGEEDEEWDNAEEIIPCLLDLQALKVPALKDLCGRHGMKKTGKKEDLVQRLHDKALAQGDGVGIGAGAASMSMQQQGDEVNYKVKLGRAGAVLMPSRVSHSEDEDEMTAIVALTDSPTLSKMVVRGQEEGRDAEKDDSDAEAEAVEEDSTAQRRSAPHRPMLAKDMKATASKLVVEADLHVQNADETEEVQETGEGAGEWKDGAAFAEELEAEGLPLTVRENDFAAAIEKMQTYIDLNARKKAEGGSDQACADDASSVGSKPALNPYASSMKSRLDSLKSQVFKGKVTPVSSAEMTSGSALAKTTDDKQQPVGAQRQASGPTISSSQAMVAVAAAAASTWPRTEQHKDGAGRNAPTAAGSGPKSMSTLNGGKSASTVGAAKVKIFGEGKFGGGGVGDRMGGRGRDDTGGGGGQGSASEKRKLQPVSAASVNARLLQPLKSLTVKKDHKTTLVPVISKTKEGGGGGGGGGGGINITTRDKTAPHVRQPFASSSTNSDKTHVK